MDHALAFSPDYATARQRIRTAAQQASWSQQALAIGVDDLTIDVLWRGPKDAKRVLVVSSGLHGIEGYLGSAIQQTLFAEHMAQQDLPKDVAIVFLHALNPYGFTHLRRVNEDNIDLNRNFLGDGESFTGSPPRYEDLDSFFNPKSAPRAPWTTFPRALWLIARHGLGSLKQTLPVGQYDFPKGLFFGGHAPSKTQQLLDEHLPTWLGHAEQVVHVDFHTGLGPRATYKLFINREADDPAVGDVKRWFDNDVVEAWDPAATSYTIRGGMGTWLAEHFPNARYDELTAEFGTRNVVHIVEALRSENRAHHWGTPGSAASRAASNRMMQAFAPIDGGWRRACVEQGVGIVGQALDALLETA
jgi:hypothetical protein